MSSQLFKKLTSNSDKVWVVGDIHGQYDLLMEQLAQQHFDPSKGHLLVSVGDLVDRGPDSLKTLELLTLKLNLIFKKLGIKCGTHLKISPPFSTTNVHFY